MFVGVNRLFCEVLLLCDCVCEIVINLSTINVSARKLFPDTDNLVMCLFFSSAG